MTAEPDTTRATVSTYVPTYQKERWREHADELGMSQSEFVRAMVQAGRRGFGADEASGSSSRISDERDRNPVEGRSPNDTPRGDGLEDRVLEVLDDGPCSWEELVDRMTDDLESRLDETLERLQRQNRVRYSGRRGGYTRVDDEQ